MRPNVEFQVELPKTNPGLTKSHLQRHVATRKKPPLTRSFSHSLSSLSVISFSPPRFSLSSSLNWPPWPNSWPLSLTVMHDGSTTDGGCHFVSLYSLFLFSFSFFIFLFFFPFQLYMCVWGLDFHLGCRDLVIWVWGFKGDKGVDRV